MGLWERVPLSALAYTVVHSPQLGAQPPVHALSNQTSSPILIRSQLDQAGCLRNHLGNHYGTFWGPPFIQGDPKKMSLSVFELKSVLDVGFYFSACGLETESRARFISPL